MEKKIQDLHTHILNMFPDAVSVEIFVNSNGIEVIPKFKTDLKNISMQTITGIWVHKIADI